MEDNNQNPIQEFGTQNNQTQVIENNEQNQNQAQAPKNEQSNGKTMNSFALASFICSLIGLVVCGLPLGIVAIITSVKAKQTFNEGQESNKWMATFGLVLGIIDIICVCFYLFAVYNTQVPAITNRLY